MWRAYLFGKEKLKTNIQISTISIARIAQIGIGKAFFIRSIINTKILKTRFSKPQFSEILDLMNKLQLAFSYFTLYPDSI